MVQVYIEIVKNGRQFISCVKFLKIFIESFNEISLIRRSVNNSNSYTVIDLTFDKRISTKTFLKSLGNFAYNSSRF